VAFSAGSFAVTSSAQKLADVVGEKTTLEIVNPTTNSLTVWVGGSNVAVSGGRPILPGESWAVDLDGDDDVYIRASGSVTVYYARVTK